MSRTLNCQFVCLGSWRSASFGLNHFVCCGATLIRTSICLCLKLVDPIESRCKDDEFRAQAARDLLKSIDDCRMAAKSLSAPERDAVSY